MLGPWLIIRRLRCWVARNIYFFFIFFSGVIWLTTLWYKIYNRSSAKFETLKSFKGLCSTQYVVRLLSLKHSITRRKLWTVSKNKSLTFDRTKRLEINYPLWWIWCYSTDICKWFLSITYIYIYIYVCVCMCVCVCVCVCKSIIQVMFVYRKNGFTICANKH